MARRSPRQQGKHDKGVKATADYYSAQSYKVEADIEGFELGSQKNCVIKPSKGGQAWN